VRSDGGEQISPSDLHFERQGRVGKSNISINLAIALARAGRKTLIWDADLGLANIDVLLGLNPSSTSSTSWTGRKSSPRS